MINEYAEPVFVASCIGIFSIGVSLMVVYLLEPKPRRYLRKKRHASYPSGRASFNHAGIFNYSRNNSNVDYPTCVDIFSKEAQSAQNYPAISQPNRIGKVRTSNRRNRPMVF